MAKKAQSGAGGKQNGAKAPAVPDRPMGMADRGQEVLQQQETPEHVTEVSGGEGDLALSDDDLDNDLNGDLDNGGMIAGVDGQRFRPGILDDMAAQEAGGQGGDDFAPNSNGGQGGGGQQRQDQGAQDALLNALSTQYQMDITGYESGEQFLQQTAEDYEERTRLEQENAALQEQIQQMLGQRQQGGAQQQSNQQLAVQQPQQQGVAPAAFQWQAPQWNPEDARFLQRGYDKDGNEVLSAVPGAPTGIVNRYLEFQHHAARVNEQIARDPVAFLQPIFQHIAGPLIAQAKKEAVAEFQAQQRQASQQEFVKRIQLEQGYYEVDANGRPKIHPRTRTVMPNAQYQNMNRLAATLMQRGMDQYQAIQTAYETYPPLQSKQGGTQAPPQRNGGNGGAPQQKRPPTYSERLRGGNGGRRPNTPARFDAGSDRLPTMGEYGAEFLAQQQ